MSDVTGSILDKNIISVNIEDEMRGAYLDYAMSVIIGRALPDVRDGLKPVHRRVLFAMHDLSNTHNKAYKKSARVVGDVIGKYHPHGDTAVYDTIVRLAQDFSMRYPLIDGQGNFGSIDGDAAAAMRYTEVRMEKVADELLADLEKETVDLVSNYDESLKEPTVFPTRFPNLLINGSSGIAVGMATNIPSHNLIEVVDAVIALIKEPSLEIDDLLKYIQGPDFPTAGMIIDGVVLRHAYKCGRGSFTIRGKAEIEPSKADRERIVISELPYQVNKAKLIEKIAELVKEKRIEGVSDIRDESNRVGIRVVIDLKKGEAASVILNNLYKLTPLQTNFGISLLAIHHNRPKIFNIKEIIQAFIEHRREVVLRRTVFDLRNAEAKAHILEGLKKAVENLDPVIALIKNANSPEEARNKLKSQFQMSEKQAQAVLEMRLQRLTGLERDKIIEEHKATLVLVSKLELILSSEPLVYEIICTELEEVKEKYGDQRRTIVQMEGIEDFEIEDLIPDTETLISITHSGYIKRSDMEQFRIQHRGGKGIRGVTTSDDDFVRAIYRTTNLSYLLCFTDRGRLCWLRVYKVPEAARTSKGKAIVNLIALLPGEKVRAVLPVREFTDTKFIVMVTRAGVIKKTALSEFQNVRNTGIIAITIDDGDQLISAKLTDGEKDIFICSGSGKSIRFNERDVRSMGRTARGVIGMDLEVNDSVVAIEVLNTSGPFEILTVTESGFGKRTPVNEYRAQSRGGKGIITMKTTERNGEVVSACQVLSKDGVMLVSSKGQLIRINVGEISEQGRNTQGVRLMEVSDGEKVVAMELIADNDLAV